MKVIYIVLGFICLAIGIIAIFVPLLPTTPFLLLTLFFFTRGSERLRNWFLQTSIYQKHLKSFNEERSLTMRAKISILAVVTPMLLAGMYFTPPVPAKIFIGLLLVIKYWAFFGWIKTRQVLPEGVQSE